MSTGKLNRPLRGVGMAARLWGIMMVLVLLSVGFMWLFQIVLMERNYIESQIAEVQSQLEPIMGDLETEDLAYNEQMISYLSSTADGKMLIVSSAGQLIDMYTFGHPIDLSANHSDVQVWERIVSGENYPKIWQASPIPARAWTAAGWKLMKSVFPSGIMGKTPISFFTTPLRGSTRFWT